MHRAGVGLSSYIGFFCVVNTCSGKWVVFKNKYTIFWNFSNLLYTFVYMEMTTVKISKQLLRRIKKHVKGTRQTITGFVDICVTEQLQKEERLKYSAELISKANGTNS